MPHPGESQAVLSTAPEIQVVAVGGSPYTFVAADPGRVVVQGGTVTLIEVGRGGTFVTTGITVGIVPVSRGDSVRVTYAMIPTMNYFKG